MAKGVGHYGVFNGSRWRSMIEPRGPRLHPGPAAHGLTRARRPPTRSASASPAIEVRLRRSARARRMVLRVSQGGTAPTLTLPPGVALAQARRFVDRARGLAAAAYRRRLRAPAVGDGTVLPLGDATLTVRVAAGGRIEHRAARARTCPGPPARVGPRAAAWLREEARRACVAAVGAARGGARTAPGPGHPARPALALGVLQRRRAT